MFRTWAREIGVILGLIFLAAMAHATAWPSQYDGFWYETFIGTLTGCIYLLIPAFLLVRLVRVAIDR